VRLLTTHETPKYLPVQSAPAPATHCVRFWASALPGRSRYWVGSSLLSLATLCSAAGLRHDAASPIDLFLTRRRDTNPRLWGGPAARFRENLLLCARQCNSSLSVPLVARVRGSRPSCEPLMMMPGRLPFRPRFSLPPVFFYRPRCIFLCIAVCNAVSKCLPFLCLALLFLLLLLFSLLLLVGCSLSLALPSSSSVSPLSVIFLCVWLYLHFLKHCPSSVGLC
jgi:hypothetical protein